ncbi:hypothetical protein GF337_12815 [candidate division KSB1 bacterium]|nr:hypothetical protein [candidate division KSB1 bacterium]
MKKIFIFLLIFLALQASATELSLRSWTYIAVDTSRAKWGDFDDPNWLRYFGLSFQDVNHDAFVDIVSGRYVYLNPGGKMLGPWQRIDLGFNVDAMISVNIDDDAQADVIAQALPDVYWLEAEDATAKSWKARVIAQLPKTGHTNGQGYRLADVSHGGKPEMVMTANGGVYAIEIPPNPAYQSWRVIHIVESNSDEGFDCTDIDGDGDLDVVAGSSDTDGEHADILSWYENPGRRKGSWKTHKIGMTVNAIDRVEIADLDNDGMVDVAVAEEQFPPKGPTAYLFWFEQKKDGNWERHTVVEQWSLHNLDAGDIDQDGDIDLVTCEHKGDDLKLQVWENDGDGNFSEVLLDQGKESHLGTQLCDLDQDGDPDIVSIAWDNYKNLHLWRNDAISFYPKMPDWNRVSNIDFDFPISKTGAQVATLVFDVDKDEVDDFVIASYTGMEWYKKTDGGNKWSMNPEISWERYVIDHGDAVHIEAGGESYDIDGDGDLDIVMGGSWKSNQVWWWENPYPDFEKSTPWKRYLIKDGGKNQHHDQIIDDFDGDGRGELFFWNQRAKTLYYSEIPKNPKQQDAWFLNTVYTWESPENYEGLAAADIDQDGLIDLVGGGLWFKYISDQTFQPNIIDDYPTSRSATGDLIKSGRPEVVIGSGDTVGPLNLYEWKNSKWNRTTLLESVDHGHTLQVADINADGYLDIYTVEMHSPGAGELAKQWILYGDGAGNFRRQVVSVGTGTHEGALGDLDGDGDLDILQKDFNHQRRIDIWLNNGIAVDTGDVRISTCFYKGSEHFKIKTISATYFLEKSSGGFSSIFDNDGRDWVAFSNSGDAKYPESAARDYRGVPNMVHGKVVDAGAGHPGFNVVRSAKQVNDSTIRFVSDSGGFVWSWTFSDHYAKLTIEETIEDQTYWVLYEGPVAGNYHPQSKYWGTDEGMRTEIPDFMNDGKIEETWQWVYFGDVNVDRVLFIAQKTPDDLPDVLGFLGATNAGLNAIDGMVVFGFGRNKRTKPLLEKGNTFYFGFYESGVRSSDDYKNLSGYVGKFIEKK